MRSICLFSLLPSVSYIHKIPPVPSFLQAEQLKFLPSLCMRDTPVSPSASWPVSGLFPVCTALVPGHPDSALQVHLTRAERKMTTSFNLTAVLSLIFHKFHFSAQDAMDVLCHWVHGWLMFSLLTTRTPKDFFAKLLSSWSGPSLH